MRWLIGGVPEHFNLPWQDRIAAVESSFPAALAWQSFPGGTGAMIEALRAGQLDLALLLTEGAVAGRAAGGEFEIVSHYVTSPLRWGIHVRPASGLQTTSDLRSARFAISRFGSGSHLMAIALAQSIGWVPTAEQFVVVGSLDGAIDAFATGGADAFLWEHFMTRPVVERGDFRWIGDFAAPWAAFVTVARRSLWQQSSPQVRTLIEQVAQFAQRFADDPDTPARIHRTFGIAPVQAADWLESTQFASGFSDPAADIVAAEAMLERASA